MRFIICFYMSIGILAVSIAQVGRAGQESSVIVTSVFDKSDLGSAKSISVCELGPFLNNETQLCFEVEADYSPRDHSLFISKPRLKTELLKNLYDIELNSFELQFSSCKTKQCDSKKILKSKNFLSNFESHLTPHDLGYLSGAGYILVSTDKSDNYVSFSFKLDFNYTPAGAFNVQEFNKISLDYESNKIQKVFLDNADDLRTRLCALKKGLIYCWGGNLNYKSRIIGDPDIQKFMNFDSSEHIYQSDFKSTQRGICWWIEVKNSLSRVFRNCKTDVQKYDRLAEIASNKKNHVYGPKVLLGSSEDPVLNVITSKSFAREEVHCAIFKNSRMKCWGYNRDSLLDIDFNGSILSLEHRGQFGYTHVSSDGDEIVDLKSTSSAFCALLSSGRVKCWGSNKEGQLGVSVSEVEETKSGFGEIDRLNFVDFGNNKVKKLYSTDINNNHIYCARFVSDRFICWGRGNHFNSKYSNPVKTLDFGNLDLVGSKFHMKEDSYCLLLRTGDLKCWSFSKRNSFMSGHADYMPVAQHLKDELRLVPLMGGKALDLKMTSSSGYVLQENNEVRSWGFSKAMRGDPKDNLPNLLALPLGPKKILDLYVENTGSCVLFEDRSMKCWGNNLYGQTGHVKKFFIGESYKELESLEYLALGNSPIETFYMYSTFYCAIFENAKAKCWGNNIHGFLGQDKAPTRIIESNADLKKLDYIDLSNSLAVVDFHYISASTLCAEFEDHSLKCWGQNLNQILNIDWKRESIGNRRGDMKSLEFIKF